MKNLLTILILSLPILASAQDAKQMLKEYFSEVEKGKYPPIPPHLGLPENAKVALVAVGVYEKSSDANIRSKAYSILRYVGTKSRDHGIREEVVNRLVAVCKDGDTGNLGTALSYLTLFLQQDFTEQAKGEVKTLLQSNPPFLTKVMKLVGFLKLSDMMEVIRPYTLPGNSQSVRWAAIVSLARMGDAIASEEMLTRAKKIKMSDDVVFELFPDLIYSHYREAYDYMVETLMSDEKNCLSTNPDREEPILCGYRVMEMLAPVIEGYPLQVGESGDLVTDNYEEALKTVRVWFGSHKDYWIVEGGY